MTTQLKWRRVAPGYYEADTGNHRFTIEHRLVPAANSGGWGRVDDWLLRHTGPTGMSDYPSDYEYSSDPLPTLHECKQVAQSIVETAGDRQ